MASGSDTEMSDKEWDKYINSNDTWETTSGDGSTRRLTTARKLDEGYGFIKYLLHASGGLVLEGTYGLFLVGVLGRPWILVVSIIGGFFLLRVLLYIITRCSKYQCRRAWCRNGCVGLGLWTVVLSLLPFLGLQLWFSYDFLQAGVPPSSPNRTCIYELEKKTIKSFWTHIGWENNTVTFANPAIRCRAVEEHEEWAKWIAPHTLTVLPLVQQLGIPFFFLVMMLGAMSNFVKGTDFELHLAESYINLQFAVLDFYDACDMMAIGLNTTNFVFFSANAMWGDILPVVNIVTYTGAVLEACMPYRMLPGCRSSDFQISEYPRTSAFLSMAIDLPLLILRAAFALNGLSVTYPLMVKNVVFLVTQSAIIASGSLKNCVTMRIAVLLRQVPGFKELDEQVLLEQIDEGEKDFAQQSMKMKSSRRSLQEKVRFNQEELRRKEGELNAQKVANYIMLQRKPHPDQINQAFQYFAVNGEMDNDAIEQFAAILTGKFDAMLVSDESVDEGEKIRMRNKLQATIDKIAHQYVAEDKVMRKPEFARLLCSTETWQHIFQDTNREVEEYEEDEEEQEEEQQSLVQETTEPMDDAAEPFYGA